MIPEVSKRPTAANDVVIPNIGRLAASLAWVDFSNAFRVWPIWVMLGWQDIRQRYRRSTLGPFWLTLSMGIMVGSIGGVYAGLFNVELDDYLPFVALGFILWGLLSGILIDGCTTFVGADSIIKEARLPLFMHAFRIVWRQVIIFAHNFVIYLIVAVAFAVWPKPVILLVVPAFVLWVANAVWISMLLGLLCARFRDIPQIVNSIVQLAFLVTPIIWKPNLLSKRTYLLHGNPLYHFMEVMREPLLGVAPSAFSWYFVIGTTVGGWLVTFELFRRYRWRVAYWL